MFRSERLTSAHDVNPFDSGQPPLDDWLKRAAVTADRAGTARVTVWIADDGTVAAYFATAPHVVSAMDVPEPIARGSPGTIPAILLARLALRADLQGQGLGAVLLVDALAAVLDGIIAVGGRVIVVDAIDDAAVSFYRHEGFLSTPPNERRLVMKASKAAVSLGRTWP